ncbi:MAG: UDP-2,3-diacylglucosamine diphosphatase [Planctomycetes bacterium]|nr:UDP-2,3-diacylglucosamine diphosphatase [Planctomycetota bacterium]
MDHTLFAGDIHLRPDRPETRRRFFDAVRARRGALRRLVLLGDVFDYWIGPRQLDGGEYREVLEGFAELTRSGVHIDFIHGNRDYFVEGKFARRTGVRVAGSSLRLELGGRNVECAHGDFIFNRNPKYAAYRRLMRFSALRAAYQAMPAAVGKSIARGFRVVSRRTTPAVSWTDEDLLGGAEPLFARGVDVLICGHIHKPAHLACERGGRRRDLFVVGDWDGTCDVVEFDGSRWRFGSPF